MIPSVVADRCECICRDLRELQVALEADGMPVHAAAMGDAFRVVSGTRFAVLRLRGAWSDAGTIGTVDALPSASGGGQ